MKIQSRRHSNGIEARQPREIDAPFQVDEEYVWDALAPISPVDLLSSGLET
jgi:hypothetical protein